MASTKSPNYTDIMYPTDATGCTHNTEGTDSRDGTHSCNGTESTVGTVTTSTGTDSTDSQKLTVMTEPAVLMMGQILKTATDKVKMV